MTRKRAGSFPVCCLLLLLIFGAVPVTHAAAGTAAVCALVTDTALGLDQAPVTALLETRLAQETGITLVDRGDIARVLHEQTLARLFGPEDGKERIATGRILKADLLILLQAGEREVTPTQKSRFMNIVISETAGGLRLLVRTVPWTANVEVDAAALQAVVRQGLRKSTEKITAICAVPPLVSNDLTHDEDYLQNSFARLLEQRVLEQPGIVAVELNEARAIASEYALSATGAQVVRPLPFYLYGEYRHDGVADARRMTVSLALRQGERQLQQVGTAGLRPEEAGPYLLKATGSLLNGIAGQSTAVIQTGDEARQLTERAQVFFQISNWEEALALYQASLLLKPDQPQALYNAALAASRLAVDNSYIAMNTSVKIIPKAAIVLHYYKLVREYVDAYQRMVVPDNNPSYANSLILPYRVISSMTDAVFRHKNEPAMRETIALYTPVVQQERDRLLNSVDQAIHLSYQAQFDLASAICSIPQCGLKFTSETKKEYYTEILCIFRAVNQLHFSQYDEKTKLWLLSLMLKENLSQKDLTSREYADFLEQLSTVKFSLMPQLLVELQQAVKSATSSTAVNATNPLIPPASTDDEDIQFTPIELTVTNSTLIDRDHKLKDYLNWLPCCAGIDVVWCGASLYLIHERGKAQRIYRFADSFSSFTTVCFDGKYIWAPTRKQIMAPDGRLVIDPMLLVVDPISGQQWQFTAQDGLPPGTNLVSTVISPGKICLAGALGARERTWCALLTLSPQGRKSVEILLEARSQPGLNAGKPDDVSDINLAFFPTFAACLPTLTPDSAIRLLIGRTIPPQNAYPLLIDLQTRKVTVLREDMPLALPQTNFIYNGALYFPDINSERKLDLSSISYANLHKQEQKLKLLKNTIVYTLVDNNRFHFITYSHEWWTAKNLQAPIVPLHGKLPKIFGPPLHSQVYGILCIDGTVTYAVSFPHGLPKSQPTAAP